MLGIGFFAAAAAQSGPQEKLEQWLGDRPGGVAAAVVDESGIAFFSAGQFASDDPRPVTPDTMFEIGSVTKVFTAILLAESVREGKVTLDARVGAPFAASQVTYLQLATHTSGLPRLPPGMAPSDPANPYAEVHLPVLVNAFDQTAGGAQPSRQSEYSNFGFAVLGQALAAAWRADYDSVLRDRVLTPLGLRQTTLAWRAAPRERLAPGHNAQGRAANWDLAAMTPAGGLASSARELALFLQACLGLRETPLAPALAMTVAPRADGPRDELKQGLGWMIRGTADATTISHGGGTGGYRSFVVYRPAQRKGVVVLTNHTEGVEPLGVALLTGRELGPRQREGQPDEAIKEYLGNYPLAPSFVIAITGEGEDLWLQATNQPRLKLKRIGDDAFAVEGVDARITFERTQGAIAALVLHQNGLDQRAPRLSPGQQPAAPREVSLREDELDAYVGEYQLGPARFTVKREELRLMVQLSGQPFFQVFPSAKDEFFYKVVNAQLSFVRDADQKVVALILHQHGRDQRAERVK